MLFESKAHAIMFFTALASAILIHAFFTTKNPVYLFFAVALCCVLIAALFIIEPPVALDIGTTYLIWAIAELAFYGLTPSTLVPIGLAVTAFIIAHQAKNH